MIAIESAPTPRAPDFLGIGAKKAGSTWLYQNLFHHPQLWMPPVKELQYFDVLYLAERAERAARAQIDRKDAAFHFLRSACLHAGFADVGRPWTALAGHIHGAQLSDAWYLDVFGYAPADRRCGEITPEYALLGPSGVAHALRLNPALKAILLVRDPIERALSDLNMQVAQEPSLSPKTVLGYEDLARRSDYATILSTWRGALGADRVFVAPFDAIARAPLALLERLCGFLQVSFEAPAFPSAGQTVFAGPETAPSDAAYRALRARFEPIYDALPAHLDPEIVADWRARHYA